MLITSSDLCSASVVDGSDPTPLGAAQSNRHDPIICSVVRLDRTVHLSGPIECSTITLEFSTGPRPANLFLYVTI